MDTSLKSRNDIPLDTFYVFYVAFEMYLKQFWSYLKY